MKNKENIPTASIKYDGKRKGSPFAKGELAAKPTEGIPRLYHKTEMFGKKPSVPVGNDKRHNVGRG